MTPTTEQLQDDSTSATGSSDPTEREALQQAHAQLQANYMRLHMHTVEAHARSAQLHQQHFEATTRQHQANEALQQVQM